MLKFFTQTFVNLLEKKLRGNPTKSAALGLVQNYEQKKKCKKNSIF